MPGTEPRDTEYCNHTFRVTCPPFTPSQKSSVLLLSIAEILRTDIKDFLSIFIFLLIAFYLALYFLYPRSGDSRLRAAPSFNDPIMGLQALVDLAFYGANAELNLKDIFDSDVMNWMSSTNLVVWVIAYHLYTLIALICLLNLLIAMLSATFEKVQEEATLAFRVAFARNVLKFEMTARYFYSEQGLFSGERTAQVCASLVSPLLTPPPLRPSARARSSRGLVLFQRAPRPVSLGRATPSTSSALSCATRKAAEARAAEPTPFARATRRKTRRLRRRAWKSCWKSRQRTSQPQSWPSSRTKPVLRLWACRLG